MTKQEKIEKALKMTGYEFRKNYESVNSLAKLKGYVDGTYVRIKLKRLGWLLGENLGVKGSDLNIPGIIQTTILLDQEEQKIVLDLLDEKIPAGRPPLDGKNE